MPSSNQFELGSNYQHWCYLSTMPPSLSQGQHALSLTGAQMRAARGLLNMSASELAERTGLALNTIRRAEATNGPVAITAANATHLMRTLEQAGVIFIPADELGPGVRLASAEQPPLRRRRASGDA